MTKPDARAAIRFKKWTGTGPVPNSSVRCTRHLLLIMLVFNFLRSNWAFINMSAVEDALQKQAAPSAEVEAQILQAQGLDGRVRSWLPVVLENVRDAVVGSCRF